MKEYVSYWTVRWQLCREGGFPYHYAESPAPKPPDRPPPPNPTEPQVLRTLTCTAFFEPPPDELPPAIIMP